jgi:hypothetical protein
VPGQSTQSNRRDSGQAAIPPGDLTVVDVETAVPMDMRFMPEV